MKHVLSFLFLLLFSTLCLSSQDAASTVKILSEDGNRVRTGFTSANTTVSASALTLCTLDYFKLYNWYIKSGNTKYLSWVFGTLSFQGIVSYAKNPNFSIQTNANQKITMTEGDITPILPGISSSAMKNSGFIKAIFPVSSICKPEISALYSTLDMEGKHPDNTAALSVNFPCTLKKASVGTSFSAFLSPRNQDREDSWYSYIPYSQSGQYFLFTNRTGFKLPFIELGVTSGMSEISKSQWKYSCLSEAAFNIPVKSGNFRFQGQFFICDADYLPVGNDPVRNTLHASVNPQVIIPLNKKKSINLSLGILGDYSISYTKEIPSMKKTQKILKSSMGIIHNNISAEIHSSFDNILFPSFISTDTCTIQKLETALNIWRFSPIPLKISGSISYTAIPLAVCKNQEICLYTDISLVLSKFRSLLISAGGQIDVSPETRKLTSFSLTTEASHGGLKFSGSFKQNCVSYKKNFSLSLSYTF